MVLKVRRVWLKKGREMTFVALQSRDVLNSFRQMALCKSCRLHGMRPDSEHLEYDAGCFNWLVDHLFMGGCARVRDMSFPCAGLYEESACADVVLEMETASKTRRSYLTYLTACCRDGLFILPILGDELNKILSSKVLHFDVGSESLRLTTVWRVLPQIWPFRTYARLTGILSTRWFYMSLVNRLCRVVSGPRP